MTEPVDLAQRVREAVEQLTEEGSVGFYASAVVALTQGDPVEVTRILLRMVEEETLTTTFELRCPDNGRRVGSYESVTEIPFGEEFESDRCDSPEPFVVDETDIYIRFRLNQRARSALRRREHRGGTLGKVQRQRVHRGHRPHMKLRPQGSLNRR